MVKGKRNPFGKLRASKEEGRREMGDSGDGEFYECLGGVDKKQNG